MSEPGEPPFTVLVFDMARTGEPDGEHLVSGFDTLEAATSYAIARVRASVEELRKPGIAAAELRQLWHVYGEDCSVLNANVRGSDLLDDFIATPATPPSATGRCWRRGCAASAPRLLISNDNNESVWAGGFFRSTYRLSRDGLLERFRDDAIAAFKAKGIAPTTDEAHGRQSLRASRPALPAAGRSAAILEGRGRFRLPRCEVRGERRRRVFAWPEEPTGWALRPAFLLMADTRCAAMARTGHDWISVKVPRPTAPLSGITAYSAATPFTSR